MLAGGGSQAAAITVGANSPYTEDIVGTDNTTSLTIEENGVVDNKQVVIKGGSFSMAESATLKTGLLDVLTTHGSGQSNPTAFNGRIEVSSAE